MNSSRYRSRLAAEHKKTMETGKAAHAYLSKELAKRAEATSARQAAWKTKNESTRKALEKKAADKEKEADSCGKKARRLQAQSSDYGRKESGTRSKLARAEKQEAADAKRRAELDR